MIIYIYVIDFLDRHMEFQEKNIFKDQKYSFFSAFWTSFPFSYTIINMMWQKPCLVYSCSLLPRSTLMIRLPRFKAISSIDSWVISALKVARTTLNWLRLPCTDLAVQLVMPKYFRISMQSGLPRNPRFVARNTTRHELDFPTKSRVRELPW